MTNQRPAPEVITQNLSAQGWNLSKIELDARMTGDLRSLDRDLIGRRLRLLVWQGVGSEHLRARSQLLRKPVTLLYRAMKNLGIWMRGIALPEILGVDRQLELGAGVMFCCPFNIDDRVLVGARAQASADIPSGACVGGVPARLIRIKGKV